jgi:uncharacterized membrane protein SirB2
MLADPAFLYRLLLEQAATIGCSVWWELKNRKDRYLFLTRVLEFKDQLILSSGIELINIFFILITG